VGTLARKPPKPKVFYLFVYEVNYPITPGSILIIWLSLLTSIPGPYFKVGSVRDPGSGQVMNSSEVTTRILQVDPLKGTVANVISRILLI
jgi:hypothetical protein